ncbi:auxiliary component yrbC [Vibrio ishigakensis]|uniref:Auxiliary component yrbC n=1 Tax=Vibrio ishigakensis TaxID=1481914 RepID=A0A0B8NIE4_9VIBR|nr:phospholipid-binding protein MlaC [Vibrio ishigakensis]GAM54450.1 auxiliary component yrbC [Vibrio ishigakensis]
MKWIASICAVVVMMFAPLSAAATVDKTKPYLMMEQVGGNTFDRLKDEQQALREQPELLKTVVEEELMPYVNYRYAGLKVLGNHLKRADKGEVSEFLVAFRAYLVTSYAQVLTQYQDQKINYAREKAIPENQRIVSIPVEIVQKNKPPIKIEFKWRKDRKSGEWQAFDMVAEGVSLLSSKQSEWGGKIRSDGLPAVTEELAKLAQTPIRYETASGQ